MSKPAELEKLEQERYLLSSREIWLRQRLEETRKELKSLCEKCDAFKTPELNSNPTNTP